MKKIEIDVLYMERLFTRLVNRLRKDGYKSLVFENEFYWNVSSNSVDMITAEPDLTIGSLDDDINFLKSLIDEDYDTNYLELDRLASVLKIFSKQFSLPDEQS